MDTKYGNIPSSQFNNEKTKLCDAIFKLLPYKEEKYELLDAYFDALLTRICGLNSLFGFQTEIITLMSILEAARNENDFKTYRKCILDSCSLVLQIGECDIKC